jgi:hypothetical protein
MKEIMHECEEVYIAEQVFLCACVCIMMRNVHGKKSVKGRILRQSQDA